MPINYKTIQIRFSEKYAQFFDTLFNVEISNRKADIGFIELDRPRIGPRPGTTRIGNEIIKDWSAATAYITGDYVVSGGIYYKCITGHTNEIPPSAKWTTLSTVGQSKGFFYTDRTGTRRLYRVFDKNLQYLNGTTWTNIKTLTSNDVELSTQRVPVNISGSDSTSRTTVALASAAEKVSKDAGDALNANNNIGTILLITSGIYKGCYAPIIAYGGAEYTLGGAGIITPLLAGITYKRYDTIAEALQVARGYSDEEDIYFNGITEMTWLQGYATASLINISALATGKAVKKMVTFNNYVWTFCGSTLYYTGSYPGNPLFFNYVGALTLGGNSEIVDIFQYKTRLIVLGTNFLFSVNKDLSVDRHVTSYGGIRDAYVNTGDDAYIFTNQKTLVSLQESINGVVSVTNVGREVDNYISKYNTNLCFGFDGKKIFLYGEEVAATTGTMCTFDVKRKIWILYTGLAPKSIIAENGLVYLNDTNTDIYRIFDITSLKDVAVGTAKIADIAQSLSLKEIDLSDIFSKKVIDALYFSFENYTQSINVDTYLATAGLNGKFITKTIPVIEVPILGGTLGEGIIGENTFGTSGMLDIISVPLIKKIDYNKDSANIFKVAISSADGNPFYLNQMDLGIGFAQEQKTQFNPINVI